MMSDGIINERSGVNNTCSGVGNGYFESVYRGFESLLPSLS
jgi:hypothetical protein